MKTTTTAILATALLASACHRQPAPPPQPKPTSAASMGPAAPKPTAKPTSTAPHPMTETEVKAFAVTFEQAMDQIPPELRVDFQKYMECEIAANNRLPQAQQRTIDGARVKQMTAALQANRSLANCAK